MITIRKGLFNFLSLQTSALKSTSRLSKIQNNFSSSKSFMCPSVRFTFSNKTTSYSNGYETMKKIAEIEKQFQAAAKSKNYEKCIKLLEEKIEMKKPSPNTSLMNDYRMLGELNQHYGKGQQALNAYEEALALAIKLESKDIQAFSMSDIAGIYYLSENFQQASGYYEESITILKQIREKNDKDIAMGLLNLGESLVKNQDGNRAIVFYQQAKEIYNALLEDQSLDETAKYEYSRNKGLVCDALGSLHLQLNKLQEAQEELQTALGIYSELFGTEDPILVGTLTNLAILFQSMKQEEDALKIYQKALKLAEINSKALQLHETLSLMLGCAKSYNNLGRHREALEMFEKLETTIHQSDKKGNQQLLSMIKGHKGYLMIQIGEFDKAKVEIQDGLGLLKDAEYNIHKAILQTQLAYILLHKEQNYQDSFTLASEAYHFMNKLNPEDPNCGDCLRIMGLVSSKLGQKEKAKEYLTQSLEVLVKSVERSEDAEKVRQDLKGLQ